MARILIVDDEPAILQSFGMVLEYAGYEISRAASAADAKQKIGEQSFDVVITDVRMETPTSGFEVVRATRQRSPRTPVALLTAFPVPTDDWKSAGADAFFSKGADMAPMLNWIRSALEAAGKSDNGSQGEDLKKQAS